MKRNEMFRKKGMLIIMMMLSCLNLCAYTYHFKCDYQGVRYNVNFTSRQAWASGLSSPVTTTNVTIQSFTLTGSQIKEIYGNTGNFTIDGEAVDENTTYYFETKEIANQSFKGSSVKSVSMDNSVITIGSLAFQNCTSLQTVQLGNQVKTIDFEAFEGCTSLKNVQLSQSLETIGIQAFKNCLSLQTIHIPAKVQLIDSEAFMYCGLTSISFAEGCPLTKISYRSFSDCTQLVGIELPGKVENVGSESFYGCTNLQSIKFPSSLLKLENYSVFRCPNLTEVYCYAENVPSAGGYAFFMANNESFTDQTDPWAATLYVPATAIDAYKNAAVWKSFGTVLPIPDGTTYLVTGITLNQNAYSLDVGNSFQLTATITPNYATNKGVTWSSSNTSVATVSTTGLVTAKSPGTATITCTAKDGSGVKATCSITVNNILVTNITLNSTSKSLDVGNTYQLTATVTPINATNKGVTWSSSNTSVATVSTTGLVTAKSPGTATITCTAKDGSGVKATCSITVRDAVKINTTHFPDVAFRDYVSNNLDTNGDGYLNNEEIAAVKTINVNNQDIYDLKGIEFFTALTTLNCRFTKMTAIDVSQNTALTDLDCRNNSFTALDVTKNTALVSLKCARNKITALDVSKNTKLNLLRCNYNQLTVLNVSKCTQLQRLDCFGNKIGKTAMDNLIASLPSTTNGAFYVIDTTLDSEENVCTTDQVAAAKAKGWTVYDYNNNSPVEYAGSTEQELGDLNGDNAVNGTDLVMQTTMILAGQYNAVADMNHDGLVNGTDYVLMVNKILGVSTAPRLLAPASASAGDATLSIEDFTISAGETKEMLIDMNNPSDEITLIQFDLRLPDGLSIATEGGEMLIDIAGRTTWRKHSLNANTLGDVTRFLLSSPTNAVISGTSGAVISITLTASDNFNGGTIQLENQLLVTPSADETKPADYSFTIEGNVPQGISIDEANFPDQKFREYVSGASIDKNQDRRLSDEELAEVTAIDVSNQAISSLKGVEFFTSLTTLKCGKNNLTMLDVSKNTAISYLYCDNNPLSSLDVTNNVALELLSCFNGQLTSLDVSKNAALKYLYCDDNSLKSLDVTKNAALSILSCDDCQLSSLDLSNNPALTALSCNKNLFTSLDVSKNTALTTLYCYINSLTALDVSNNTSLSELYCDNNQLTTLDLSKNTALTTFTCFNNMISESEMDQLVNSLPTVSNGKAYMICTRSHTEENVVNTDQVALAKSKGWTVFDYNGTSSEEYEGSATTGISGIDWDASGKNVPIHTLSGQRLTTPRKGINIIGGKKVVVK